MGPGMPGVNMWAFLNMNYKLLIITFSSLIYFLTTIWMVSLVPRGPGTGRPWPNPSNTNSVSMDTRDMTDVIEVLCVAVSTDSWTQP